MVLRRIAQKYDEMIYYFLKAGYHVCMPEHMGHGLSYRLTEDPSLVHIDTWKRFLYEFSEGVSCSKRAVFWTSVVLFAHSMGGAIGTIAAAWETGFSDHTQFADDTAAYPEMCHGRWLLQLQVECLAGKKCKVCDRSETLWRKWNSWDKCCSFKKQDLPGITRSASNPEIQTSAASYGWLLASTHDVTRISWMEKTYCIYFRRKMRLFLSAIQKFAKKLHLGQTSCEYMYMPGSKHEIFGSDDDAGICRTNFEFWNKRNWEKHRN